MGREGEGRIGAALRRGRAWGPCREAGLVEEAVAPGCSGGGLCAPQPASLLPGTRHRRGAVIHGQCLCAGGETWLEQSCRFQRLVSEAQTLEGNVVIAFS